MSSFITDSSAFYPNEIFAAQCLFDAYILGVAAYCLLVAQMQSGKSNSYMLAACELVRAGIFEEFVVISGNSETELKRQASVVSGGFWESYKDYLQDCGFSRLEACAVRNNIVRKFKVLWGADLTKAVRCGTLFTKTLFVWDESHYAQTTNQRPDKFFRHQGLQPDGSLSERGNCLLSVSATPFSETIDNENIQQHKHIVKVTPGIGYIGVSDMLENGQVQSWVGDYRPRLAELLDQLSESTSKRNIGLVRVSHKTEPVVAEMVRDAGIDYVLYDMKHDGIINDVLNGCDRPRVVAVKNKVRMGKRIEKRCISWGFETLSTKSADTLLQGLIGRLCGYPQSGSSEKITIYVHENSIPALAKYADWMGGETDVAINRAARSAVPAPAMNVKSVRARVFLPTIPDKLLLQLNEWDGTNHDLRRLVLDHIQSPAFVSKNEERDLVYMKAQLVEQGVRAMTLTSLDTTSHAGHKDNLERCHTLGRPLENPGSSCGAQGGIRTIRVCYSGNLRLQRDQPWEVYLQYNTEPRGGEPRAVTTKREVFCTTNERGVEREANGMQSFALTRETSHCIRAMGKELWDAVTRSQFPAAGNGNFNCIESCATNDQRQWQGIVVTEEVYIALQRGGSIYKTLLDTRGITLVISKARGRRPVGLPEGYIRLTRISWLIVV